MSDEMEDGELAEILTASLGTNLETYGIKIEKIETKMLDLPDENKEAVYIFGQGGIF